MRRLAHIARSLILEDDFLVANGLAGLLKRNGCKEVVCMPHLGTALSMIFEGKGDLANP
jgi:two-component SAPR family response regulator